MSEAWLGGQSPQSNPLDRVNDAARQRFHPAPLAIDPDQQLRLERLACEQLAAAIFEYSGMRVLFELVHAEGIARITVLDGDGVEAPYQRIMSFLHVHYNGMAKAIVRRTVYQRLLAMQSESYLARAAELHFRLVGQHVEYRPHPAPDPLTQPELARLVGSTPLVVGVLPTLLPGNVDIVHLRWEKGFEWPASLTDIRTLPPNPTPQGRAQLEHGRSMDDHTPTSTAGAQEPGRMPPANGNGVWSGEEPPYWLLPHLDPLRTVPSEPPPAWAPVPLPELPPDMAAEQRRQDESRTRYDQFLGPRSSSGFSNPSRPSQPPISRPSTAEDPWASRSQRR
jgi:hypothetical protein